MVKLYVLKPAFTRDTFVQLVLRVPEEVKYRFCACHTVFVKDMATYFNTTFIYKNHLCHCWIG